MSKSLIIYFLIIFVGIVKAEPTCFNSGELAGVIFGCIFGTVLITTACYAILAFFTYKHKKALKNQIFERAHGTQETDSSISTLHDFSEKGITTDAVEFKKKVSMKDKETEVAMPTPLPRRKGPLTPKGSLDSSQRSRSLDILKSADDNRRENQERALSNFGFSIGGDEYEGIFIDKVLPGTPAELSGNIFPGDKIKTLTIGFDEMSYDEALAILALVTEHTIRLDLERIIKLDEETQTEGGSIKADMRLPLNLLKSFSMNTIRRKLEACPHRNFGSLEHLDPQIPALPKKKKSSNKNIPLPSCKHCFEEERIIKVVRHLGGKIKSNLTVTSEEESSEDESKKQKLKQNKIPPGHGLIRAEEFDKRIKNSLNIESQALKISSFITPSSSGASSQSSEEESLMAGEMGKPKSAVILTTEASIQISSETQIHLESMEIPLPPRIVEEHPTPVPQPIAYQVPFPPPTIIMPPPPPPPSTSSSEDVSEPAPFQPSPESAIESLPSSPELKIEIDSSMQLAITSPKMPAASLTPDFVEVRAQKIRGKDEDEKILDRKLPEIPSTALRKNKGGKQNAGQMYLKVRNGLREVYTTDNLDNNKAALSMEQYNTLETNRRKLEAERQQLRELGIM